MKVLFGKALRQTTGFVESLLRLIGLVRAAPDFSTIGAEVQVRIAVMNGCTGLGIPITQAVG